MKVLILLALAAYTQAIAPGVNTNITDCLVDVIFVLDVSGSIDDAEFSDMIAFVHDVAAQLNVDADNARVGAVKFGSDVYPGFDLIDYVGDSAGLLVAIDNLSHHSDGSTNIGIGIEAMTTMFNIDGRNNVPWVGIVVTDGRSNWGDTASAAAIAHLTTTMIAVGVGTGANLAELNIIASDPSYVLTVSDFDQLADEIQQIAELTCTPVGANYVCEAHSGVVSGPMVKTFDGLDVQILNEQKTTMFKGKGVLGDLDPCKTQIRCVTTRDTTWYLSNTILHLDWCGIALNVHQSPTKSHRNWIVGQTLNHIGERGQGLKGDYLLKFADHPGNVIPYPGLLPAPYRAPACDPQQEAQVVGNSITITSPCCNWCVVWTPQVGCTSIEIIMDDTWAGQTEGMCGNSDGQIPNDWTSCDGGCFLGEYACLSDACAGGGHDAQAFVGGTRIHEDTDDGSAPPDACWE